MTKDEMLAWITLNMKPVEGAMEDSRYNRFRQARAKLAVGLRLEHEFTEDMLHLLNAPKATMPSMTYFEDYLDKVEMR